MPADTINRQLRGSFYRGNRLAFVLAAAGALMGAVLLLKLTHNLLADAAASSIQPPVRRGALPFRILVRACGGFFLLLFCGLGVCLLRKAALSGHGYGAVQKKNFAP